MKIFKMTETETQVDVLEVCTILQCLGFTVKSMDTSDCNLSQESGVSAKTVVVNCPSSGLHVVLENVGSSCSCPETNLQNSGFWQVSGVAGGIQHDKESGSTMLLSLSKQRRDRFAKELRKIVQKIKNNNEDNSQELKEVVPMNKSTSMIEMNTPTSRTPKVSETPMYRSLDTLTGKEPPEQLPQPGPLQKHCPEDFISKDSLSRKSMCGRQSTFTLPSPKNVKRRRNKTSSPIQATQGNILDELMELEKTADELRNKLINVVRNYKEQYQHDSSVSSLALDVSKISILKGTEATKNQFVSSPNLSSIAHDEFARSRLNRLDSVSTSNLTMKKSTPISAGPKVSKLRRLSPNFFSLKKDNRAKDKSKLQDKCSKLQTMFKPKVVTPVRVPKTSTVTTPNTNSAIKKYSHVKSTIPRPSNKKE